MSRKKPPSSLERKKLRERRARASALAGQSSVRADKKQAWWCQKKKGPMYSHLPSSQRKKRKWEDSNITPSRKPKEWASLYILSTAFSFYLFLFEYNRLNTWFLSGPDTIYLDYGIVSLGIAGIVALLDMAILGSTLNAFFADLQERFHGEKPFRGFWRESAWRLFFLLAVLALLHSLILVSCLSRTEVTTTGASTYFLGIRTSYRSFDELSETEVYITKSAGLNRGGLGHSVDNLNYILRFQDGYELHLVHSYITPTFVHGWSGKAELDSIVLPLAPQKSG